ncbi:hypothetical protein ALO95_200385 [Pseudomonas syringae pv. antirrhini]|nr:hypothetical protein ALO95_200385 [Pseudomonas syringae pv. antirrhini]
MNMNARMFRQPRFHSSMLVGRIVIDDQVKIEVFGRLFIDLLEKGQPLLMPVLTLDAADQFSLKIIQCSE